MTNEPQAPERIWVDDERSIGGMIGVLEKEPPYTDDPYTTCYVPEALYDAQAEELAESRAEVERLKAERDGWASMVGGIVSAIPLGDTLKASATMGDLISYLKDALTERDNLRTALAKGGE